MNHKGDKVNNTKSKRKAKCFLFPWRPDFQTIDLFFFLQRLWSPARFRPIPFPLQRPSPQRASTSTGYRYRVTSTDNDDDER